VQISVIIPTYNRSQTLPRALDSVIAQSYKAAEIIVVDDGSSDDSAAMIENNYPQVTLIRQHNKGVSAARNTAIKHAQSDWIALLDSDDEWLPHKLETIRQAYLKNPQQILFHSDELWIRNGRRVNPMKKHAKQGGMIFQQCLPLCVISPSAAVIQRSVFDSVGLFDETLPACEDYDLWLRLCHLYEVFYIDEPLIKKYGGHEDQLSRKFWGMDRFRIRALKRLLQSPTLNRQQQTLARSMLVKKLRILLKGAYKHHNQQVIDEFEPLLKAHESEPC
jgi:glycosyltransferase involved in cell wall biosynthesis